MTINIDSKTWFKYPAQVSGGRFYSDEGNVPAGISDGDSVTRTFPGAGSNISASATHFLGGSAGVIQSASNGATFNSIKPSGWVFGGDTQSKVSTAQQLNGKSLINDLADGYQFGFTYDAGAERPVMFARWSYYLDTAETVGQLKMMRFAGQTTNNWGLTDSDTPNLYYASYPGGSGDYVPVNNGSTNISIYIDGVNNGGSGSWGLRRVWVTMEVVLTADSTGVSTDGEMSWRAVREDTGAVLGSGTWTNRDFKSGSAGFRYFAAQFYMGNEYALTNTKCHIDRDLYLAWQTSGTTKPKYILMGDASTFASCTKLTICPFTTWTQDGSDADVTLTVNQGQHANLTGKYLYAMSAPGTPINSSGVAL